MRDPIDRLSSRFEIDDETGCWLWTGQVTAKGYGKFSIRDQAREAHRVAYELVVADLEPEQQLDHLCRIRNCINPDHLEPVTLRENVLRGESFSAINARRTACVNGHAYTTENTYRRPNGARDCRTCIRLRSQAYQARKANAA